MKIYKASALAVIGLSAAFVGLSLLTSSSNCQSPNDLLVYRITGSASGSHSSAMSRPPVQKLLLDLAIESRRPEYLDAALSDSGVTRAAELDSLGLVRQHGDSYSLNCFLMTRAVEAKCEK